MAFNPKNYQASLAQRFNNEPDNRDKIKAEMNRVARKTGVGVDISGGQAYLAGQKPSHSIQPYKTVSTQALYQNMGPRNIQAPRPTTPQTFNLGQIQNAIDRQRATGQQIAVDPARFQNTQHLANTIQEILKTTQPLTQSQKESAEVGFNTGLNKLQSSWASRGLGASGGVMAKEAEMADALSRQMRQIDAEQQANAIPLALQYGQLGLQESGQRFAQQADNRNFEYGKESDYVNNLRNALAQQEQMRQFEQNFGLDLERLNSGERQAYQDNLARAIGMDMNQNQWSQEFGLNRDQFDWGKRLDEANLTGNWNGQRTLQGSQFDWSKALGESQLTGMYDGAKTWDRELAERQLAFNQAKEARISSGGGRSGGSSGGSSNATYTAPNVKYNPKNSANVKAQILDAKTSGATITELEAELEQMAPIWAQQGVDIEEVMAYIRQLWAPKQGMGDLRYWER